MTKILKNRICNIALWLQTVPILILNTKELISNQINLSPLFSGTLTTKKFISKGSMLLRKRNVIIRGIRNHVDVFRRHHDRNSNSPESKKILGENLEQPF
ncbi:hypothetical protein SESBI_41201 [Sesbania bispinosa]|nr:hypothetical protein SESBI_41201 [Sesbania bispinosa]